MLALNQYSHPANTKINIYHPSPPKKKFITIYPLQVTSLEFKCDYMASTPPISVHKDRYW